MNLLFTWWLRTQIQWTYKSTVKRLATDTQVDTDIPTMLPASQDGDFNMGGWGGGTTVHNHTAEDSGLESTSKMPSGNFK